MSLEKFCGSKARVVEGVVSQYDDVLYIYLRSVKPGMSA